MIHINKVHTRRHWWTHLVRGERETVGTGMNEVMERANILIDIKGAAIVTTFALSIDTAMAITLHAALAVSAVKLGTAKGEAVSLPNNRVPRERDTGASSFPARLLFWSSLPLFICNKCCLLSTACSSSRQSNVDDRAYCSAFTDHLPFQRSLYLFLTWTLHLSALVTVISVNWTIIFHPF